MTRYLLLISIVLFSGASICQEQQNTSLVQSRKNSVYVQNFIIFPTLNYDRVISVKENFGVIPKIGFGFYDAIIPVFDASLYFGGYQHMFEIGGGYWAFEGGVINANYRYMGSKGLLMKGGLHYIPGEEVFPIFAIGYSF